ncbi:hypothetical protein C8F01DRAFT_1002465 [Mycena amicta]|nr:hypothetical protein C8F01DRAFT_1002465 [Mycena amicta]
MSDGNAEDVRNLAAVVSSYETEPDLDDLGGTAAGKRKRYASSDNPMSLWIPHAATFLEELIRREGLGDSTHNPHCARCSTPLQPGLQRLFRCRHCGDYLQCEACLKSEHRIHPLHIIEEWNGNYWCRTNVHSATPNSEGQAGLNWVFQVGHHGYPCANPSLTKRMVVIDVRGVFTLRIRTCRCTVGQTRNTLRQLLAHGWYPATTTDPETCATLEALELFRLLQVVGNVNAHDFVGTLERLTDATRVNATLDRYKAFFRMSRQHSYLTRGKRSGRAHDAGGLQGTGPGGLAVSCWACPQPGRNLPDGWNRIAISSLMIAVDANFRLKNRIRANERPDPALGEGQGYFVETKPYKEHLKTYIPEKEFYSCAAFAALTQQDTKVTTGLRVSGVGGVVCARHGLVRRRGMGDLQKGERFANMDYIVLATLQDELVKCITISYDIACHWQVLLPVRADRIRERGELTTDLSKYKMQFALPVWHASAHEINCRSKNTLSHAYGVGKTDGEGIERTWSLLNPIGWSTKEMGEGARHDAIEDKIDHLNFEKNVGQGKTLLRKLIVATAECKTQEDEFEEMTQTVSKETVNKWSDMVRDWEKDKTRPNPYLVVGGKEAGPSERQVMEQLKAAELEDLRTGRAPLVDGGKMTAAAFIKAGLQLEEMQRRILAELKAKALITADRSSAIQEQRFALVKKLKAFHQLQLTYMPGIDDIRSKDDRQRDPDEAPPKAEHTKIYLPSELSAEERRQACARGVADAEAKLRLGQCVDSLATLRVALYTQAHITYWRNSNSVGQKGSTRSATLLERIAERRERAVLKYRQAYTALVALKGTAFAPEYRKLEDADVNARTGIENDFAAMKRLRAAESSRASRNEPSQATANGRISWIWGVSGGSSEAEMHDSVRVNWTKARTRRDRWREEVALLQEEMKRVLRCLAAEQREWEERGRMREEEDAALTSGLQAYAARQSRLHRRIGETFYEGWNKSVAGAVEEVMGSDGPLLRSLLAGTAVESVGVEGREEAGEEEEEEEAEEEATRGNEQETETGPATRTRAARAAAADGG